MSEIYPPIEPFASEMIAVSDLHTIYVERCGHPEGIPVLFLHGGPGGGIDPFYRRLFDPARYHIILVDQRGCGKSTPHAELTDNTTWDLIADFEQIRQALDIKQWVLFGGSWGSTLALAYAQKHPDVVSAMVLRGIFLGRPGELDWIYRYGASEIFPEAWAAFKNHIPADEQGDLLQAYQKRLHSSDHAVKVAAAKAWAVYETSICKHVPDPALIQAAADEQYALAFSGIEIHYFSHDLFLKPNQLLDGCHLIEHIPTHIVQGRYDVVCPMASAQLLHQALPLSTLHVVPDAGHSLTEPGIAFLSVEIMDQLHQSLC